MSWIPSADPLLGDKRSCDALELVIVPRVRDLGNGFAVRRAMPNEKRQLVGPFTRGGSCSRRVRGLTLRRLSIGPSNVRHQRSHAPEGMTVDAS
jgi:hypothetical protein